MPRVDCSRGWGWRCPEAVNPVSECVCACGGKNHGKPLTKKQKAAKHAYLLRKRVLELGPRVARPAGGSIARPAGGSIARPAGGAMARPAGGSIARPAGGSIARPAAAVSIARPAGGVIARPAGGLVARPADGSIARPAAVTVRKAPKSKKWEYLVLTLNKEGYNLLNGLNQRIQPVPSKPYPNLESPVQILNKLGEEGWEVSAVTGYESYLLKRVKH